MKMFYLGLGLVSLLSFISGCDSSPSEPLTIVVIGNVAADGLTVSCTDRSRPEEEITEIRWILRRENGFPADEAESRPGATVFLSAPEPGDYTVRQIVTSNDGGELQHDHRVEV